jgi:hypothetical protein
MKYLRIVAIAAIIAAVCMAGSVQARSFIAGGTWYNDYVWVTECYGSADTTRCGCQQWLNYNGAQGVTSASFGPDGSIYSCVVSTSNNSDSWIMKFTYAGIGSGYWYTGTRFATLPVRGGNCVVDSAGNVYVASNGGVPAMLYKFNNAGVQQWAVAMPGNNPNTFDMRMGPVGLLGTGAKTGAGDVWVSRSYWSGGGDNTSNPGIVAFNPGTGANERQIAFDYTASDTAGDQWAVDAAWYAQGGFDFGPDGNAYLTLNTNAPYGNGGIARWNMANDTWSLMLSGTSNPSIWYSGGYGGNFPQPISMCLGPDYYGTGNKALWVGNAYALIGPSLSNATMLAVSGPWDTTPWTVTSLGTIAFPVALGGGNTNMDRISSFIEPTITGATVTANVTLQNYDQHGYNGTNLVPNIWVKVQLRDTADTTTLYTQTVTGSCAHTKVGSAWDLTDSVTFTGVTPGSYLVRAWGNHWISDSAVVTVAAGQTGTVSLPCYNGDINGDNFIEDQDYSLLGVAWYSGVGDSNYNVNADLNGDGYVEDQDYSIMGLGWYMGGS